MTNHFDIEPLESRQLLSITWVNRGKADHFNQHYGDNTPTARAIVDAAIADWNRAIPGAKVKLTISAASLNGATHWGTLGATRGTTIRLDRDASSAGWYFDKNLIDNTEYADRSGLSQLIGGPKQSIDFYSVVAHEIGHALGFADDKSPFRSGRLRDPNHADYEYDLMTPEIRAGTRRYLSPYDVRQTKVWKTATKAAAFTASATTGAPQLAVGWTDFYPGRKYSVYRSTRPGADHKRAGATLVATTKAGVTSFLDSTAESGRTYYYFVVPVGVTIKKEATAAGLRDASAVPTVQATTTEPRVSLTWTPVQGARYYAITVSTDTTIDDPVLAAVVPAGTTTWTDPASLNGAYRYRVKAIFSPDGSGAGVDYAQPVIGRAPGGTGSETFGVTIGKSGLPELRWGIGNNPDGGRFRDFRVYRAVDSGSSDRLLAGATPIANTTRIGLGRDDTNTFADATARPGVSYRYWVVGVLPGKKGSPELEVPIGYSVVAGIPPAPAEGVGSVRLLHNGSYETGPIAFEWDPVPGASEYVVHVTGPNATYDDSSYYYEVRTGTSAIWGFSGRVRLWVTAVVEGQPVIVGSVGAWHAVSPSPTADATGVTLRPNDLTASVTYTDIYRTTSPDDLGGGSMEFLRRIDGKAPSFLDTTAAPGVTYYYWSVSCYNYGSAWLIKGFTPVTRP